MQWLLRVSAAGAGVPVFMILVFLVIESWPVLDELGLAPFIRDQSWHPTQGEFGLLPMLAATACCTLGALLLAVPWGIGAALYSRYYAPVFVAGLFRRVIELLAGVPSVVYGLWGLTSLVPLIGRLAPPGASLLAGALILALMILPTIALTTDAALGAVPPVYLYNAAALGMSRWGMIRGVALPAARSGIASGILLAAARAMGETMAVLMVCGNVVQFPHSLFDPVRTLTANIALEMAYAMGDHRASLFVSGLVLMAMVLGMVWLAERRSREV